MAAPVISRYIRDVKYRSLNQVLLLSQLKRFVADMFRIDILVPDNIADDAPLTGGTFDLDSLDMLELAICVEEQFGIAIRCDEESRAVFRSIGSLAEFIHVQTHIGQARQCPAGGAVGRLPAGSFARTSVA
jgi:acyl carrier protein